MNNSRGTTVQKDLGIMVITFFHFCRTRVFNAVVSIEVEKKKILIGADSLEFESKWCHVYFLIESLGANIKCSANADPIQKQEIKGEIDKYLLSPSY